MLTRVQFGGLGFRLELVKCAKDGEMSADDKNSAHSSLK